MITINDLPKDVFFIIFNNLPSTNLHLIECVSRKWRNMLKDGYFRYRLRHEILNQSKSNHVSVWTIEKNTYNNLFDSKCGTCFGNLNGHVASKKCVKCKGWFHFKNTCMPYLGPYCYECYMADPPPQLVPVP